MTPIPDWLTNAAELLDWPDPGPTPFLVDELIVDRAIVAAVGRWKTTKSYALLDICISVATGRPAFGTLAVPEPGPVVFVNEESGYRALQRRLVALCRGRDVDADELDGSLYLAANERVRLDDMGWQRNMLEMAEEIRPRLICFDPLARMKGSQLDENTQSGMAVLIDFVRQLRDASGAAVLFVHHTGHTGDNMRGSSDLESAWESRLAWKREGQSPLVTITSEHREAESGGSISYRIDYDADTRTMRFDLETDPLEQAVRRHLAEYPEASANDVDKAVEGSRKTILSLVRSIREGGSQIAEPPRNHPLGLAASSGSPAPLFRGAGTTSTEPGSETPEPPLAEVHWLDSIAFGEEESA